MPKNQEKLVQILKNDARPEFRANASFLLAHIKDGFELVKILEPSVFDSHASVRNNVLRVLSSIAAEHSEINIDLELILRALDFPDTTDRNKASWTLVHLSATNLAKATPAKKELAKKAPEKKISTKKMSSKKLDNQELIRKHSLKILLKMAKLKQPNNRVPACLILKNIGYEKAEGCEE